MNRGPTGPTGPRGQRGFRGFPGSPGPEGLPAIISVQRELPLLQSNLETIANMTYLQFMEDTSDGAVSKFATVLNAYTQFINFLSSRSIDGAVFQQFLNLPWNKGNPITVLYNLNPSPYWWVFANSLQFLEEAYKTWYSLSPFPVSPVPPPTYPSGNSLISNTGFLANATFTSNGTGFVNGTSTVTQASSSVSATLVALDGAANGVDITSVTPPTFTRGLVTVTGGTGAVAYANLGISVWPISAGTYISSDFIGINAPIRTLLGLNAGNPNVFGYLQGSTFSALDILVVASATSVSVAQTFSYVGFILRNSVTINSNMTFENCIFNIDGSIGSTGSYFIVNTANISVIFNNCIFRNPVGTDTKNVNCRWSSDPGSFVRCSQPCNLQFISNLIDTNMPQYSTLSVNLWRSIITISAPPNALTQTPSYLIHDNVLQNIEYTNLFNTDTASQSGNRGTIMNVAASINYTNTFPFLLRYYDNVHIATKGNTGREYYDKDFADILLYGNLPATSSRSNFNIQMVDPVVNQNSNFFKIFFVSKQIELNSGGTEIVQYFER